MTSLHLLMDDELSGRTDADLIEECLEGNAEAWEVLVNRYKRLVYSIPIKWGMPLDDAAKVFEAVWRQCLREIKSLKDLDSLQPWLIRTSIKKCQRFRRRNPGNKSDDPCL